MVQLSHPYMTTWKTIALTRSNHSCDHMDHSLILLNETMSHAIKDHPRWMGYGGEFWQNVLHWRKECLENPMNSMKRQKNCPRKEQKNKQGGETAWFFAWWWQHRPASGSYRTSVHNDHYVFFWGLWENSEVRVIFRNPSAELRKCKRQSVLFNAKEKKK